MAFSKLSVTLAPSPLAHPSRGVEQKEPLQVRIPTRIKRRFKARAAMRGIEPNALLVELWEFYEAHHSASVADVEE
jgi:hypothetical protein